MVLPSIREGVHRTTRPRIVDYTGPKVQVEDSFEVEETPCWSVQVPRNGQIITPESKFEQLRASNTSNGRDSRMEVEVKLEPSTDDDEDLDDYVDEHTAELEAQLASEALKNGLALFGKEPSAKKLKTNGSATSTSCGDIVTANCEMCGTFIRLNSGGSKWNFYEHVMMKHSEHKPFKCPICPYKAGRKVRVKQHGISQHSVETEPVELITPEIRSEWLQKMSQCFPDHKYTKKH